MSTVNIIIVDKNATLKSVTVKEFHVEELYKKCGFKKPDDFKKQTEWKTKIDGKQYFVNVYAKEEGRANGENKYDFPPPIDTKLFFGSCAIVAEERGEDGSKRYSQLTVELWEKIYEKLFGGFEDLKMTTIEDDEEEDELANVPASKKTKQGYLKDGFVVDSDSQDEEDEEDDYGSEEEEEDNDNENTNDEEDEKVLLEEIGSELSEEEYEDEDEDEDEDDPSDGEDV
jgi:hypothetical protein